MFGAVLVANAAIVGILLSFGMRRDTITPTDIAPISNPQPETAQPRETQRSETNPTTSTPRRDVQRSETDPTRPTRRGTLSEARRSDSSNSARTGCRSVACRLTSHQSARADGWRPDGHFSTQRRDRIRERRASRPHPADARFPRTGRVSHPRRTRRLPCLVLICPDRGWSLREADRVHREARTPSNANAFVHRVRRAIAISRRARSRQDQGDCT